MRQYNKQRTANSTYKKLAVQWLNEVPIAIGMLRIKFCGGRPAFTSLRTGRQFSALKSPTSCSCKPLSAISIKVLFKL